LCQGLFDREKRKLGGSGRKHQGRNQRGFYVGSFRKGTGVKRGDTPRGILGKKETLPDDKENRRKKKVRKKTRAENYRGYNKE